MRTLNRLTAAFLGLLLVAALGCDKDGATGDGTSGGGGGGGEGEEGEPEVPLPPSPATTWVRSACSGAPAGTATWPESLTTMDGATRPARLIIEAVSFDDGSGDEDFIIIRNVSDSTITFNALNTAREGWRLYVSSSNFFLPVDFNLRPNETVTVWTRKPGRNDLNGRHIHLRSRNRAADLEADDGEIAIFRATEGEYLSNPDLLEAFIAWGSNPSSSGSATRRDEAVPTGLWSGESNTDFITTSASDSGIIAIGDVTSPRGWAAANVGCFQSN